MNKRSNLASSCANVEIHCSFVSSESASSPGAQAQLSLQCLVLVNILLCAFTRCANKRRSRLHANGVPQDIKDEDLR